MNPTHPSTACREDQDCEVATVAEAKRNAVVRPAGSFALLGILVLVTLGAPLPTLNAAEAVATGIIQPVFDARLSASASGIVTQRHFKEGDRVKAGDVLLELDNGMERLEVDRRRLVRNQKSFIYEGTKKLFGSSKGVSKEELETSEMEFKVAEVEHEMAQEALRRKRVVSPHAAEIVEIHIEVGEACQENQPVVRVVDNTQCYFVTNLEPAQRNRFKKDQKLKLEVDLAEGRAVVEGVVVFLSPVVDPASGLSVLKVLIDNKDGRIRPGLTGVVLADNQG